MYIVDNILCVNVSPSNQWRNYRAFVHFGGGGGKGIFIYSCSTQLISFEMNLISKEIRRAEHEYMNIPPPPSN